MLQHREHVHGRAPVRVARRRQIKQCFDRRRPELPPQTIIILAHVLRRWVQRPLAVNPPEILQADPDSAVALIQSRVEIDAQVR
jgi:hypothetical protein